ncbi:DNA replication complex GINS protein PSF2-like [Clavelina lepadiformis]|uniref:DNA replication complex GINS protein PSF2 n=1 Tax=Clavelina lepadiformis TaxID=159417 RepID=A0ABP0F6M4_CLALP
MEPGDVEFIAEKELVKIVPNFALGKIYFISGDVGPFSPGLPVDVPLWLAIAIKQRQKCRVHPPEWLDVDKIETMKDDEIASEFFTELPNPHFCEVAQLLLTHATDNIPNADLLRTLIKDIWDIRAAKLRSNIDKFVKLQAGHARLDNLSQMEINTIRPFLTASLDHMYQLRISQSYTERNMSTQ